MNGSISQLTRDATSTTLPYKGQPHLLSPMVRTAGQHTMPFKLDYNITHVPLALLYENKICTLGGKKKQVRKEYTESTHMFGTNISLNAKTLSVVSKHEPHLQANF